MDPVSTAQFRALQRPLCLLTSSFAVASEWANESFKERCSNKGEGMVLVSSSPKRINKGALESVEPLEFWRKNVDAFQWSPDRVVKTTRFAVYPLQNTSDDFILKADLHIGGCVYLRGREILRAKAGLDILKGIFTAKSEYTLQCVPIQSEKCDEELINVYDKHDTLCWPLISEVHEKIRSARLGAIGYMLGLRHTVISFMKNDSDSPQSITSHHTDETLVNESLGPLLLDKTADVGTWFRYASFEKFTNSGCFVRFDPPVRLDTIWESMRSKAEVTGPMRASYTCQHFSRDCLQAIGAEKRQLYNHKVFSLISGWTRPSMTEFEARMQQRFLRWFKSADFSHACHSQTTSWRQTLKLDKIV